ncbi:MAG: TfoX/Sxy family protein [Salinivirgaceae bacterium]|nr:TfoX/Sxy family protein [Salinivirgaceae bacterium]
MASTAEYIEFVCSQLEGVGVIRSRKMFGDYCIYVNEKPIILACDNQCYVKKHPAIADMMVDALCGFPYDGAKEHYILDIEHRREAQAVVSALLPVTPYPKKRK